MNQMKTSLIAFTFSGFFLAIAIVLPYGTMNARAWVIWPVLLAAGLVCLAVERKK